jgi:PAS domain S-box-containing protein
MKTSALVANNHVLDPLFKYTEDPVLLMKDNQFISCNNAVLDILQLSDEEECLNLHPSQISPVYQPDGISSYKKSESFIAQCYEHGFARFQWAHQNKSNQVFLVEVTIVNITYNKEQYIISTWRSPTNIERFTEQGFKKEHPLLSNDQPYFNFQDSIDNFKLLDEHKKAIDASSIVSKTDTKGIITYVNENFCLASGYSANELLGNSHNIVNHPDMPIASFDDMWNTLKNGKVWRGVIKNKKKTGEAYYVDSSISPIKDKTGEIKEYIAIRSDITEIFKKDEIIHFLNIDSVTQLDNRSKLDNDISNNQDCCLALLVIPELFDIQTIYAPELYNNVLLEIANFITQEMDESYSFYRIADHHFAVLVNDANQLAQFRHACEKLLEKFEQFLVEAGDSSFLMSMRIGMARHSDTINLYNSASIALRVCEEKGYKLSIYDKKNDIYAQLIQANEWAKKIRACINSNSIGIFGQKIVDTQGQEVSSEVLMRYYDEQTQSYITPFAFLEYARRSGLYNQLSLSVLTKAFIYYSKNDQRFSVNLTMNDIEYKPFALKIIEMIEKYNVGPRLTIELVETTNYEVNNQRLISFLLSVKNLGCQVAIDDFGSGYSNFEYLTRLPIDMLKIDGSLIRNIESNSKHYLIVKTLISFCQAIDVKIVAEFIENENTFNMLKALGVHYFQGYYFHEPTLLE